MRSIRVPNRGGRLWFVVAGLLAMMSVISRVAPMPNVGWGLTIALGSAAAAALAYGLIWAKLWIELGDEIVIQYVTRSRIVRWSEISYVDVERGEGSIGTGIPFMRVPTENYQLVLRLRDGKSLRVDIMPSLIGPIAEIVAAKASLDHEHEQQRLAADATSEARTDTWLSAAIGLVFFFGGLVGAVLTVPDAIRATASIGWPTVPAKIVSAEVKSSRVDRDDAKRRTYSPAVRYAYQFNGRAYEGNRFSFGPANSPSGSEVQSLVTAFRENPVVHIKPGEPGISVVQPGMSVGRYTVAVGTILVSLAGLCYAAIYARRLVKGSIGAADRPSQAGSTRPNAYVEAAMDAAILASRLNRDS